MAILFNRPNLTEESKGEDPFAVALGDMGGESSVNDSSEVDLMAGDLFEVQVRNDSSRTSTG